MSKKEKKTVAEQDGVTYRRAKTWHIALSQLTGAAQMCFYMFMTYATYIGNSNFGILVGVTGVIITLTRIFDGVTDPLCGFLIERINTKHGKIRIFMMAGWATMALATTAMCNWGAGHLEGIGGLIFFIICYMVYIIGYTLVGVSTAMTGSVMTNDPRQRPALSVWSTVYSYIGPMVISMLSMVVLLPQYNYEIGTGFLGAYNKAVVVVSLVIYLISCIGIAPYDKTENFDGLETNKNKTKTSVKDMLALLRENKELQRYMIAACSDKLTQSIGTASVITTMLFGIMIGNMSISTILTTVAMVPSIIFAIIGGILAGRKGNRKIMISWTWVCIALNVLFALFLLCTDTTQITVALVPTVIFFVFTLGNNATKMVVSTATTSMRMDVIDYEMYRSGRYMPATVSATYSFLDKLISSFSASIATLMIGIIGYTATTPQQGDPLTTGVRIMTVLLYCGFPIIGWICTIVSMKKSELSKERMIEIQKEIASRKEDAVKEA